MDIKLPIYDGKIVDKVYVAESYDIMFGTVEDFIGVLDLESFTTGNDSDVVKGVAKAIPGAIGMVKPLLKDVFDGLTDEELKRCKLKDIISCVADIIKFSVAEIAKGTKGN